MLEQVPDGQHPFTTSIYNFAVDDTINPEDAYTGSTTESRWDPAKNLLCIEVPASTQDHWPEILAQFTLEGTWANSDFTLTGNIRTRLLSLNVTTSNGWTDNT